METYSEQIKKLTYPTFKAIKVVAENCLSAYIKDEKIKFYNELNRGVALLDSHEQLCQYMASYGNMHQAKLLDAFSKLPIKLINEPFEVIDWGCGQAMGTVNLFDFLLDKGLKENIKKITLIEPSKAAIERAILHTSLYVDKDISVISINDFFENIKIESLNCSSNLPVIHIFSNILDVFQIDLKHLASLIDKSVISDHYLLCVGPLNPLNKRLDAFFNYFNESAIERIYEFESYNFQAGNMTSPKTFKAKIYRLEFNQTGHLIPIEYYPAVQFQAAYELDIIRTQRKILHTSYNNKLSHYEVAAPFDLGASVYDDVHPILAVLNNIITRGLPTKASPFIEEQFVNAFLQAEKTTVRGEFIYITKQKVDFISMEKKFMEHLDKSIEIDKDDIIQLQLLLTPLAIARFQKVLVEAIITKKLSCEQTKWKFLIEEADVPFAALAISDFESLFNNLTQLSEEYENFRLPIIELHILSNHTFINSPLHLNKNVFLNPSSDLKTIEFDLVITQAILKSVSKSIDSFSKFRCRNNCYFNIRSIEKVRTERVVYTSNLIKYKSLVERDSQGNITDIVQHKEYLRYFLQLLFRKEEFRPGQLPILDRALQNLPVIGLLPTGGGKSLTYQIAAFLQPGVTIVVDPLKSLMQDQYDGLHSQGIDNIAYINSTLTSAEKKVRELKLESSQLLIVFLSPERLSIASFRERLKKMSEHNVYFSYGVIDEVHCVSEWGHDFRFSYLHLGRNLYNYVRAKEGAISLFGLTATASFDVLADVERELSGNGAFKLDADVIVRYENVNRLELQYKIEKVPVQFSIDGFYDPHNIMPSHLPKAVNITNHWPLFDSKGEFLDNYLKLIPSFLNELQENTNVNRIKSCFLVRQNINKQIFQELITNMPDDFYLKKEKYEQAGIIFCPHVNSTGLSVIKNSDRIKDGFIPDVGSFSGADSNDNSMPNLEKFRDDKIPLMVATKAFGMGIDKPNVRFTVNMNYSSSLEAFVQEAGRAGRDRGMALSTILFSDYKLVKINRSYTNGSFTELSIIKNKWFLESDLKKILDFYNQSIPKSELLYATPSNDIVKLHCYKDNKTFGFNECELNCLTYNSCALGKVTPDTKGWKQETELIKELRAQNKNISKKYFQYLNADYQTVMYFFNESFKGDIIEKAYMNKLLNTLEVDVQTNLFPPLFEKKIGFLSTLKSRKINDKVIVYINYESDSIVAEADAFDITINRASDLSKAIYRMCCIELVEDFTQDYKLNRFRIVVIRKNAEEYFNGLLRFLQRYYTLERAKIELQKAREIILNNHDLHEIEEAIYKCLAYLTEFVYDKVSEKRKRAIDEMRNFCIEGVNENETWLESNEKLKDFIFYYFNSKYAKKDYTAENGEPFSLLDDTEGGKKSEYDTLFKYLRVIDNDLVGVGTPIDNVKHLYGAVRLIIRSLTDSNPTLYLLESFCLAFIGTKGNENLENQIILRYTEGMIENSKRTISKIEFWNMFDKYNDYLETYLDSNILLELKEEIIFYVHANHLKELTVNYTI